VLIYLDICCFNRPLDQQIQTLVRLQTEALHVASAITAGATWLLTTDPRLIRRMRGDDRIVVADPIDFIRHWQGDDDENRV
jgi:hypothetical protein